MPDDIMFEALQSQLPISLTIYLNFSERNKNDKRAIYCTTHFEKHTPGTFSLGFEVCVEDNMFFMNLSVCPHGSWHNEGEQISRVPLCSSSTSVINVARLIKRVFGEYIKNIYHLGRTNFMMNKPVGYTCYTGIHGEDGEDSEYTAKWPRLRNKTLCKYLKDVKRSNHILCRSDHFCIYDTFRDMGSVDIQEPFHYTELVRIQKDYPIIYSLLEEHGQLYSKYRKLKPEQIELSRIYGDDSIPIHEFNDIARINFAKLGLYVNPYWGSENNYRIDIQNLSTLLENEEYAKSLENNPS
jgi:hypothetical protein